MEYQTTTNEQLADNTGVQDTQPVGQDDSAAVTTTDDSTTPSNEEPDQTNSNTSVNSDNSTDDDLSDYWQKKGIDISTPEGQAQAAKSYREAERAMHQKSQQASDLEKQLNTSTVDPDASRAEQAFALAQQLQNEKIIREWKDTNNVTPQEDKAMGEYAKANPRAAELLMNGSLTLDEFRAIAVPAKPVDTSAIKQEGGQEALEKLANKQRATAVQGNAVSSTTQPTLTKENVGEWYESLGTAGRQDPANQAILQGILNA